MLLHDSAQIHKQECASGTPPTVHRRERLTGARASAGCWLRGGYASQPCQRVDPRGHGDAPFELFDLVGDAHARGIPVLIPTFAVGWAQEVVQLFLTE